MQQQNISTMEDQQAHEFWKRCYNIVYGDPSLDIEPDLNKVLAWILIIHKRLDPRIFCSNNSNFLMPAFFQYLPNYLRNLSRAEKALFKKRFGFGILRGLNTDINGINQYTLSNYLHDPILQTTNIILRRDLELEY